MAGEEKERVSVLVSVEETHLDSLGEVVERLRRAGLDVEQVTEEVGVVAGSANADAVERLHDVERVAHVGGRARVPARPAGLANSVAARPAPRLHPTRTKLAASSSTDCA